MFFNNKTAKTSETNAILEDALSRLNTLVGHYASAPLPHFVPNPNFEEIEALASHLSGFERVIILGTGGSSLGGQALVEAVGAQPNTPRIDFIDNLDPHSFAGLINGLDWSHTAFLPISKSGNTPETLFQIASILNLAPKWFEPKTQIGAIAGKGPNSLRQLAGQYGFPIYDHEDDIGGRFAVLTNVGLVPALLSGIAPQDVVQGARDYIAPFLQGSEIAAMAGAALQFAHLRAGRNISVCMPYSDRLYKFGYWYRQLWGESLGKQGIGSTPMAALGPVDQHSQLQLFIDGPDDKFFTIMSFDQRGEGVRVGEVLANDTSSAWLGSVTMGDFVTAQAKATVATLNAHNRPVRHITLEHMSATYVGTLFMHFMVETILTADLLGLNAFDQPAVEEGKILTKGYLTNA